MPQGLSGLSRLTELTLSSSSLTGSLWNLVHSLPLQVLDLSHNSLVGSVPPSFSAFENLTTLSLNHNQLRYGNRLAALWIAP